MIKPIETYYRGYRFRSRLEARWAVFFDALGIPFAYELQGYKMPDCCYLPDFFLTDIGVYIEVKPYIYRDVELFKARDLCVYSRKLVYVVLGDPYYPVAYEFQHHSWGDVSPIKLTDRYDRGWPWDLEHIDDSGYVNSRRIRSLSWEHCSFGGRSPLSFWMPLTVESNDSRVAQAMLKARQARFEHAERP